ncbi:hypothetical protein KIPB_006691, partial [Kipferlia bialata]|eukprot:g4428.t1
MHSSFVQYRTPGRHGEVPQVAEGERGRDHVDWGEAETENTAPAVTPRAPFGANSSTIKWGEPISLGPETVFDVPQSLGRPREGDPDGGSILSDHSASVLSTHSASQHMPGAEYSGLGMSALSMSGIYTSHLETSHLDPDDTHSILAPHSPTQAAHPTHSSQLDPPHAMSFSQGNALSLSQVRGSSRSPHSGSLSLRVSRRGKDRGDSRRSSMSLSASLRERERARSPTSLSASIHRHSSRERAKGASRLIHSPAEQTEDVCHVYADLTEGEADTVASTPSRLLRPEVQVRSILQRLQAMRVVVPKTDGIWENPLKTMVSPLHPSALHPPHYHKSNLHFLSDPIDVKTIPWGAVATASTRNGEYVYSLRGEVCHVSPRHVQPSHLAVADGLLVPVLSDEECDEDEVVDIEETPRERQSRMWNTAIS